MKPASAATKIRNGKIDISAASDTWLARAKPSSLLRWVTESTTTTRHCLNHEPSVSSIDTLRLIVAGTAFHRRPGSDTVPITIRQILPDAVTDTPRTILITGCSSGIGHHAAHGLKALGWRVFAAARKPADVDRLAEEGLEAVRLDYVDEESIAIAVDQVLAATGNRLEALFNNGGYAQAGALEDLETGHLRAQFETNLFGWHALTRRVIPIMRRQGHGRIVFCSSILGLVPALFRGAYVASKYAVEGYADTLRNELHDAGIKVVLIEPGPIRSNFRVAAIDNIHQTIAIDESIHSKAYRRDLSGRKDSHTSDPFRRGPDAVLKKLVRALDAANPRARYPVTIPAHIGATLKRVLPTRTMDRIVRRARRRPKSETS
ncbi:MAG: SDR family NAD(P)-dependent oxidoreductase [Hyphomicrobiales bacterium]|nr:SDR family NAD(P)-dependent oxidoreductase [Hyphomicrobiales bacterium]